MAVPPVPSRTVEHSTPAPTTKILAWLRNLGASLARPLFAVVLAIIAGSIVIFITSPSGDRLATVINAYQSLFVGSFGDPYSLSYTLVKVGPLILTGLSVSIAYRAGLFNIGAEGQLAVGAMTAGIIAFTFSHLPGVLLVPFMIIGSMIAGAIWGGIVGILKAWRGAHEVVTTIMLNWIAFYVTDYLIDVPFKAPNQATQTPSLPPQAQLPPLAVVYNQTLGTFLPQIENPQSYLTDVSLLLALLALVVYWFITSRTTFGYELRVIGQNPKAARYAGISTKRNLFFAMAIAGALSGLAGSLHLMGQPPYQLIGSTFSIDPTGFDAIGVSLLGRTTSIGVLLASLLFGGLRQGGNNMQLAANIPGDLVYILQALVLFSIAAEFLPAIQRSFSRWTANGRRPSLVPNITGATVATLPPTNGEVVENTNNEHIDTSDNMLAANATEEETTAHERRSDRIEEG
ncbi:ABC transporter permease [Reticulibacter mediterranei]|uniref:ABC transporter permease n=1 Tax=Reticulibacter mediterranei TaxID=2778369 RepID=A0A8J3IMZ1_9CHLR|nr:ABC transporter permease [Reticulibacter mediterranei]GHO94032.1 ABC transporter permease [Reticulibacter mediterranei]